MKTMSIIKKMATIGAALAMVTAVAAPTLGGVQLANTSVTASAAVEYNLQAYKLFTANAEKTEYSYADVSEGVITTAIAETGILTTDNPSATDCAAALAGANATQIEAFAKAIANSTLPENGLAVSVGDNGNATIDGAEANAYYIITGTMTNDTASAKTMGMLIQADAEGNATTTMNVKADLPTSEKKVYEDSTGTWQDVADAESQQEVKFRLYAELPSNYDKYDSYFLKFNDTLDQPGFVKDESFTNVTFYKISADGTETEITVDENNLVETATAESADGNSITHGWMINNVKNIEGVEAGDKIVVEYTAKLSEDATPTPTTGNDNAVTVEYPKNPNHKYDTDGDGTTDETPDKPDTPKGETPKDEVRVLTYGVDLDKYNEETNDKLEGAKFSIQRENGDYATIVDGKITGWTATYDEATCTVTTDADGAADILGLDEGTYTITEQVAPDGFVKPTESIELKVVRTFVDDVDNIDFANNKETNPLATLTFNDSEKTLRGTENSVAKDTGVGLIEIANTPEKEAIDLPSTGGIGTKIFTIGGAALVAGAGITLIAKKRMKKEEE